MFKNLITFLILAASLIGCGQQQSSTMTPAPTTSEKSKAIPVNSKKEDSPKTPPLPGKPDHSFTNPAPFYNEFGSNEASADAKYLGKVIDGSGSPVKVWKEGETYLLAMTAQIDNAPCLVWTFHSSVKANDLAHITSGVGAPDVRLKGICIGKKPSRLTYDKYQVIIKDAVLIKKPD